MTEEADLGIQCSKIQNRDRDIAEESEITIQEEPVSTRRLGSSPDVLNLVPFGTS